MERTSHAKLCSMVFPDDKFQVDHPEAVGYPQVKQVEVDGKIVNQIEFVVTDEDPQYKVSDFALENLLAAKVDLQEMRIEPMNLTKASEFVSGLETIPSLKDESSKTE